MPSNLDVLEALVRRMTPGPWAVDDDECGTGFGPFCYVEHEADDWPKPDLDRANADRVAACALRNVAPELIAVARAASDVEAAPHTKRDGVWALDEREHARRLLVLFDALDALRARLREMGGER